MNNNIYNIDFTTSYPPALKNDPYMLALAKTVAKEHSITANEIKNVIIYARIDELEEPLLDILAVDLNVSWYDYEYPLEVKRAIIKDSVKIHRTLGTTYAVRKALSNIFPGTLIEEWFDYGGETGYFRIVLDTTKAPENVDVEKILKTTELYKRKSAKLEKLTYQNRALILVLTNSLFYKYNLSKTGQTHSGTKPERNTGFKNTADKIDLLAVLQSFKSETIEAGTLPNRNVLFNFEKETTQSPTAELSSYKHNVSRCGTKNCGVTN